MSPKGAERVSRIPSPNHATSPTRPNLTATLFQNGFPHSQRHSLTHTKSPKTLLFFSPAHFVAATQEAVRVAIDQRGRALDSSGVPTKYLAISSHGMST
jgi:hypothetical protein